MKKILLPVVVLLASFMSACDNGAYTIDPNTDKSNKHNPLTPAVHAGGIGNYYAKVNGVSWGATAGYMDYINGSPVIYGYMLADPTDPSSLQSMTLSFLSYHGTGTYALNTEGSGTWVIDSITTNSTYGKVVVDSDLNGILRGRFNFQGPDLIVDSGFFRIIILSK